MKGFDEWMDNHGNPGIEPDEDTVIGWNIHNDHADGEEMNFPMDLNEDGSITPRKAQPMIPVELSYEEIEILRGAISDVNIWSLVIAYDPVDNAIKFKVNGGVWSPPLGQAQIDSL